jgi:hypothetical protein
MGKDKTRKGKRDEEVVRLEDLAPRQDPKAGKGAVLFGQGSESRKPDAPRKPTR